MCNLYAARKSAAEMASWFSAKIPTASIHLLKPFSATPAWLFVNRMESAFPNL